MTAKEGGVRAECLSAGHLLLEDGRHERRERTARHRQPEPDVSALKAAEYGVLGVKALGLVGFTDQVGRALDGGVGGVAPRLEIECRGPVAREVERGDASVDAHRHPRLASAEADRPVATPMDERGERRAEVQRPAQYEPARDHRRIESSSGEGPACAASNSALLRSPRYPSVTMIWAHAAPSEPPGPGRSTTSGPYSRSATRSAEAKSYGLMPCPRIDCSERSSGSVDHGVWRA